MAERILPEPPTVYRIRNTVTGERYIGGTILISNRKRQHFQALARGDHRNKNLQSAWNQYGKQAFVFEILEELESADDLLACEQKHIDESIKLCLAYNHCPNARDMTGFKMPDHVIERIASLKCGTKRSAESIDKQKASLKLWHSVPENKKRHSDGLRGHKVSDFCRKKISEAHKGKAIPQEMRVKIAKTLSGRKLSLEQKMERRRKYGKISFEDIGEIVKMRDSGSSFREIARKFGVSHSSIQHNYKIHKAISGG